MKHRLRATLTLCAVILTLSITASTRAVSALPPGLYILGCLYGQCKLYDMTGKAVIDYGMCGNVNWAFKVIIYQIAPAPPPPITYPSLDPVWQGHDAWWWVTFLKGPQGEGGGPLIDLGVFGDPDRMPRLECNEVHVNQ